MKNPEFERFFSDLITMPEIAKTRISTIDVFDLKPLMQIVFEAGFRQGRIDALQEMIDTRKRT